jgi:hypothetical protein
MGLGGTSAGARTIPRSPLRYKTPGRFSYLRMKAEPRRNGANAPRPESIHDFQRLHVFTVFGARVSLH